MESQLSFLCTPLFHICCIISFFILWTKWRHNYWTRRGIYQPKPDLFFGNLKGMFMRTKSFADTCLELYQDIKAKDCKQGGFYSFLTPTYMPVDLKIIRHVMSKDFDTFRDHGVYFDKDKEPLTGNLFNIEGEKWRTLRTKLTPLFTSGKMKIIYKTFLTCADSLKQLITDHECQKEAVDIKDVLERFTIDIIGNCAFGVDCNSMQNPDSYFRIYGKRLFERDWFTSISRIATNLLPKSVCKLLPTKVIRPEVSRFFMNVITNTVEYREKHNFFRQDFMHQLLHLKNHGKVTTGDESVLSKQPSQESLLTLNELAAQCFVFFIGGYETSATTMTFALFELARHPDIQEAVRSEVRTFWEIYEQSYDAIMEMPYLEKVILEVLRKYPPVVGTTRACNRTYKVPGTNTFLEKGTSVHIPIIGVHMDPDYYPDPEKFDPERFDEVNKASRPGCTWMPFGYGPRTCIGLRFGMLQSKVGIATIVNNFRLTISEKTQLPLKLDPCNFIYASKDKIWLNIEKL